MDGLTTCAQLHTDKDGVATGTPEEVYLNYINGPWSKRGEFGRYGRHAENYGANGGMLFMDRECSLSTGSFTAFAVVALNDQTEPGRGQFTVLRGSHHAMEKFYQMQVLICDDRIILKNRCCPFCRGYTWVGTQVLYRS
eukprot:SAG31_NODE_227_length_19818_cov_6.503271_7_plen_139_part_00